MSQHQFKNRGSHPFIFEFIVTQRTGILTFTPGGRKLFFERGNLIFATSELKNEHFSNILVEEGVLTEAQLADIKRSLPKGQSLGRRLKSGGHASSPALARALKTQITRIIDEVIAAVDCLCDVQEDVLPAKLPRLKIQTLGLFIKALTKIDSNQFPAIPPNLVLRKSANANLAFTTLEVPPGFSELFDYLEMADTHLCRDLREAFDWDEAAQRQMVHLFGCLGILEPAGFKTGAPASVRSAELIEDTDASGDFDGQVLEDDEEPLAMVLPGAQRLTRDHLSETTLPGMALDIEENFSEPSHLRRDDLESEGAALRLPTFDDLEAETDATFNQILGPNMGTFGLDEDPALNENETGIEDFSHARDLQTEDEDTLESDEDPEDFLAGGEKPVEPFEGFDNESSLAQESVGFNFDKDPDSDGLDERFDSLADETDSDGKTEPSGLPIFLSPESFTGNDHDEPGPEPQPAYRPAPARHVIMPEEDDENLPISQKRPRRTSRLLTGLVALLLVAAAVFFYIRIVDPDLPSLLFSSADQPVQTGKKALQQDPLPPRQVPAGSQEIPETSLSGADADGAAQVAGDSQNGPDDPSGQGQTEVASDPDLNAVGTVAGQPRATESKPPVRPAASPAGGSSVVQLRDLSAMEQESIDTFNKEGARYSIAFLVACQWETVQEAFADVSDQKIYIFPRQVDNHSCYMITWGRFKTYEAARSSRAQLPTSLANQADSAWVVNLEKYLR